jgi:hypothetical protein
MIVAQRRRVEDSEVDFDGLFPLIIISVLTWPGQLGDSELSEKLV